MDLKEKLYGQAPALPEEESTFLGEEVTIRGLTSRGRDELDDIALKQGMGNFRAQMAVRTIYQNGELAFSTDDEEAIGSLPSGELDKPFEVATRLSGWSKEDLDELEKNSESTHDAD